MLGYNNGLKNAIAEVRDKYKNHPTNSVTGRGCIELVLAGMAEQQVGEVERLMEAMSSEKLDDIITGLSRVEGAAVQVSMVTPLDCLRKSKEIIKSLHDILHPYE